LDQVKSSFYEEKQALSLNCNWWHLRGIRLRGRQMKM